MSIHPSPRRRWGAAAIIGATALIASLAVVPAADAATTTTVRGTVTVAGHAVAGVPVGTWNPAKGVLATGTTDAHGRFALRSPSGVTVVAYAGSKPSASKAVFTHGADHLVRGVIGAAAPKSPAQPLAQPLSRAVPSHLGGGHALRFRLQRAGRFTASSPVLGTSADSTGSIGLDHGGFAPTTEYQATADGVVTSGWLVPGRYHLVWNGNALLERTWITVRPGTTVTAPAPSFSRGATISLHVRSGGIAVPEGIPAIRLTGSATSRVPSTDASGTIVAKGYTPGTYRFTVGEYYEDPDEGRGGPPSTPDFVTKTVSVTVRAGDTAVSATVDLAPASKVTGTVSPFVVGATPSIDVEDANGTVQIGTIADQRTGDFTLGGLAPGTYRVYAEDRVQNRYDVETIVLPAAASTGSAPTALPRPLNPTTPLLTVSGTVPGATRGTVRLAALPAHHSSLYVALASISKSGRYRVRTIPARLEPMVQIDGRQDRSSASRSVTGSQQWNLARGARLSSASARFTVHGHVVHVDVQANGKGDAAFLLAYAAHGRSTAHGIAPGRYTWFRTNDPLPASDGPWTYTAPDGSFTVHPGTVHDLGTRRLDIRG